MPTGPKGQKRRADINELAKLITDIATGNADAPDDGKNKAAQELGRKGGKARASSVSAERRGE